LYLSGGERRVGKNFKRVYDFFAASVEKEMIYPERNCKNLYSCGMARWHIPTYALCQRGNKLPRLLGIYYTTGNRSNISGRMWKAHHADHMNRCTAHRRDEMKSAFWEL
jgi:hypothetical protein